MLMPPMGSHFQLLFTMIVIVFIGVATVLAQRGV
jgi:hypothetical protein